MAGFGFLRRLFFVSSTATKDKEFINFPIWPFWHGTIMVICGIGTGVLAKQAGCHYGPQVSARHRTRDAAGLSVSGRTRSSDLRGGRSLQARTRWYRLHRPTLRLRSEDRSPRSSRTPSTLFNAAGSLPEKRGGRKSCLSLFAGLDAAFLEIVNPRVAGDPMREGVLW